jgi:hypothetical protein
MSAEKIRLFWGYVWPHGTIIPMKLCESHSGEPEYALVLLRSIRMDPTVSITQFSRLRISLVVGGTVGTGVFIPTVDEVWRLTVDVWNPFNMGLYPRITGGTSKTDTIDALCL